MATPTAGRIVHQRLLALDIVRGIALLLVVEQHIGVWLISPAARQHLAPGWVVLNAAGAFGAPLFFCVAGVGAALFARQRGAEGDWVSVRRGLGLLAFGTWLNLLTPSWFSWGSFFALHLIGVGILLTPVLRQLTPQQIILLALALIGLAPVVQYWLDTPLQLGNDTMRDMRLPGAPLRQALAAGQYPVLPWLALFLAGFVGGDYLAEGRSRVLALLALPCVAVAGLGYTSLGYLLAVDPLSPLGRAFGRLSWFPCSTVTVLLMMAAALLTVALALGIDRRWPARPTHVLASAGRASLTVFLLHIPLFREGSVWVGLRWRLSAAVDLVVVGTVIALILVASRAWQRVGYRYGAEWLLRKVAG